MYCLVKRQKQKHVNKVHMSSPKSHIKKMSNPLEKWMKKAMAQFKEKEI